MTDYGASIERGEIAACGAGGYAVRSYTRDGLVTPPLPALGNAAYSEGDRVYFFVFDDGHGLILAAFE